MDLRRLSIDRPLLARDLADIDAPSDAESISVDAANNDPLLGRVDDDSVPSESDHGDNDDDLILELGADFHQSFVMDLETKGMREDVHITEDMEEFNRRLSGVTCDSGKSYIMDLARQQAGRDQEIKLEAFEDAHIWFGKAVHRGMPESKELFAQIYEQLIKETKERYAEFHKKQDQWLTQALDEYQKKMSMEQLEQLQQKAPTDDDLKKKKLAKKISKTEKLMKKALKSEGKDSEAYKSLKTKLAEYRAKSKEADGEKDPNLSPTKKKTAAKNGTTRTKSKDAGPRRTSSTDAGKRRKSRDTKELKPKRSSSKKLNGDDDAKPKRPSSKKLVVDGEGDTKPKRGSSKKLLDLHDDEQDDHDDDEPLFSHEKSTRTTRTGRKKKKDKGETEERRTQSLRVSRSIKVDEHGKPKSARVPKKKKDEPPRQKSLPTEAP